jgi:uncharacterized protein (DUF1810 family)
MSTSDSSDPFDLQRFLQAQNPVFAEVCSELRQGRKSGHWMWFIFPQLRGLGYSETARYYGISSLDEATAYANHFILGPRLTECSRLVMLIDGLPIEEIFGYPDYLKFRSSMTLFARATSENEVFTSALEKYFDAQPDRRTLELL